MNLKQLKNQREFQCSIFSQNIFQNQKIVKKKMQMNQNLNADDEGAFTENSLKRGETGGSSEGRTLNPGQQFEYFNAELL